MWLGSFDSVGIIDGSLLGLFVIDGAAEGDTEGFGDRVGMDEGFMDGLID